MKNLVLDKNQNNLLLFLYFRAHVLQFKKTMIINKKKIIFNIILLKNLFKIIVPKRFL